jgi:hypothetical protein
MIPDTRTKDGRGDQGGVLPIGMSEGLRQAGWECMLGVDNDPYALEVFANNHVGVPTLQHDLDAPLPDLAPPVTRALRDNYVITQTTNLIKMIIVSQFHTFFPDAVF